MTDRELMQQALNALLSARGYIYHNVLDDKANKYDTAIEALRARLAQPDQEPVAWMKQSDLAAFAESGYTESAMVKNVETVSINEDCIPLYTAPPQREWQGLTDQEIIDLAAIKSGMSLYRAIEQAIKEKNA